MFLLVVTILNVAVVDSVLMRRLFAQLQVLVTVFLVMKLAVDLITALVVHLVNVVGGMDFAHRNVEVVVGVEVGLRGHATQEKIVHLIAVVHHPESTHVTI